MPSQDPWSSVEWLLRFEKSIRLNEAQQISYAGVDDYWADFARLLKISGFTRKWRPSRCRAGKGRAKQVDRAKCGTMS